MPISECSEESTRDSLDDAARVTLGLDRPPRAASPTGIAPTSRSTATGASTELPVTAVGATQLGAYLT